MYQLALLQIPMSSGKVEYEQLLVNKITFKEEVRMARIDYKESRNKLFCKVKFPFEMQVLFLSCGLFVKSCLSKEQNGIWVSKKSSENQVALFPFDAHYNSGHILSSCLIYFNNRQ